MYKQKKNKKTRKKQTKQTQVITFTGKVVESSAQFRYALERKSTKPNHSFQNNFLIETITDWPLNFNTMTTRDILFKLFKILYLIPYWTQKSRCAYALLLPFLFYPPLNNIPSPIINNPPVFFLSCGFSSLLNANAVFVMWGSLACCDRIIIQKIWKLYLCL